MAIAIHTDSVDPAPLEKWARMQRLDLIRVPNAGTAEQILGDVAVHAFESRDIPKLLRQMRWSLKNGRHNVRIRLEGDLRSRAAFEAATERLQRLGYITRCCQKGDIFSCGIPSAGKGHVDDRLARFLGGGWLEVGALTLAKDVLCGRAMVIQPNVEVRAGDRHAEFDLLALPSDGGTPLVVECKSGSGVEQYFLRFAAICRMAGASGAHAVLLVRDIDAQVAADASCLHGFTILTPGQFGEHLRSLFGIDAHRTTEPGSTNSAERLQIIEPRSTSVQTLPIKGGAASEPPPAAEPSSQPVSKREGLLHRLFGH